MCEPGYEAKIKSNFSNYQMLIYDTKDAHNTPLERKKKKNMKFCSRQNFWV